MRLDCALIGGTLDERLHIALRLRSVGVCVWHDLHQSKKAASYKRALVEAKGCSATVYDLDKYGDHRYVSDEYAFRDHMRPLLAPYIPPVRQDWFGAARKMLSAGYNRETVRDTLMRDSGVCADTISLGFKEKVAADD